MKINTKRIASVAFLLAGLNCYFMITGYNAGPGTNGWDCTGAETGLSNPAGCSSGSGCHSTSATTGIGMTLELDSAGVPVTRYKGGLNYTVKLTGTNNTTGVLSRFGLQIGSIKGSTTMVTPVNAGTWLSPFPASTHYAAPQANNFVVGVVEQTTSIAATTGNGGNGSTYSKTFSWKAPNQGTGTVSLWAVLNAVNANGAADVADKWNLKHIVITELPSTTGISSFEENRYDISVFPNPANESASINFTLPSDFNKGEIRINDISGKLVDVIPLEAGSSTVQLDCSKYNNGIYLYSLVINDAVINSKKLIVSR